jgi:FkbM family methyltransferase
MYIKLAALQQKYNLGIKGIIHVGAHHGQEYEDYRSCGVNKLIFVEPCVRAFAVLSNKFKHVSDGGEVLLMNIGMGSRTAEMVMHTETRNTGQSNSLLRPVKHLEQFPDIVFDGQEKVNIHCMDEFDFIKGGVHNFLNMDVQGYEAEVLKGATETLKHIDYVYTEVNRAEVYENCARIEQLDELLKDFHRAETFWCDGGTAGDWGDAFYIRNNYPNGHTLP